MRRISRPLQRLLLAGYYVKHPPEDKELARVVHYVARRGYDMLPGVPKYNRKRIEVHLDPFSVNYVMHEGNGSIFRSPAS